MSSIEEQVLDIQTRIGAATRARVRAEHERDAASAALAEATTALREQFQVDSVEAATALLHQLREALRQELGTVQAALHAIGV